MLWDSRDDIKLPAYYGLYCMRGLGTTAIWEYDPQYPPWLPNTRADYYITRYTAWKCV